MGCQGKAAPAPWAAAALTATLPLTNFPGHERIQPYHPRPLISTNFPMHTAPT